MGYMAGDYYAGDYYAGGIFGNIFRAVTGTVGGAIGGFLKGGPLGGIAGAIGGATAATRANIAADQNAQGVNPGALPVTRPGAVGTFLRGGGRFSAAGKKVLAAQKQAALASGMIHPALAAGMGLGRRRTMRWTNTKALGRAERRIHSAVKHMTKYIRWVHPMKAGHAVPKFGRPKKKK